jgi:hypothetical protein
MTACNYIATCAAIAAELARADVTILDAADRAHSAAFFAAQDDACFRDAATAFVAAILLASCGWPT